MTIPELGVEVDAVDETTTVVRVSGEIDMATAPDLEAALRDLPANVTVDLAGVTFLDSSGLGVLVSAVRRAEAHGHRLLVVGENETIARTLHLTGLYDVLHDDGERPD